MSTLKAVVSSVGCQGGGLYQTRFEVWCYMLYISAADLCGLPGLRFVICDLQGDKYAGLDDAGAGWRRSSL
jgi:hypothetical protein